MNLVEYCRLQNKTKIANDGNDNSLMKDIAIGAGLLSVPVLGGLGYKYIKDAEKLKAVIESHPTDTVEDIGNLAGVLNETPTYLKAHAYSHIKNHSALPNFYKNKLIEMDVVNHKLRDASLSYKPFENDPNKGFFGNLRGAWKHPNHPLEEAYHNSNEYALHRAAEISGRADRVAAHIERARQRELQERVLASNPNINVNYSL